MEGNFGKSWSTRSTVPLRVKVCYKLSCSVYVDISNDSSNLFSINLYYICLWSPTNWPRQHPWLLTYLKLDKAMRLFPNWFICLRKYYVDGIFLRVSFNSRWQQFWPRIFQWVLIQGKVQNTIKYSKAYGTKTQNFKHCSGIVIHSQLGVSMPDCEQSSFWDIGRLSPTSHEVFYHCKKVHLSNQGPHSPISLPEMA